jgi:small subunit ribosomal protein S8
MQNYLGDMITRIRNGHRARLGAVLLHHSTSKLCVRVLEILQKEGYILGLQYQSETKMGNPQIKVLLKYDATGTSVIRSIFQVSKPSRRVYVCLDSL